MEPSQTAKLLAKAQLVDNRTVDAMTVAAWHEIVGPLDFDDAMDALTEHRRSSTDYLMPAHIVAGVKRIRAERHSVWNRPTPHPPLEAAHDDHLDGTWRRAWIAAVSDGAPDPDAVADAVAGIGRRAEIGSAGG